MSKLPEEREKLNQNDNENTQIDFMKYQADLNADREVVLAAVKSNGFALQFADESLRADREFMLEAVKLDSNAIQFISKVASSD